jgi:hypothetical protein
VLLNLTRRWQRVKWCESNILGSIMVLMKSGENGSREEVSFWYSGGLALDSHKMKAKSEVVA